MIAHATLNGTITNTGGENCDQRGFDWDTDSGEPYANSWTESDSYGTGAFNHQVTGLPKNVTIYFRAKAHNSEGWGYGGEKSFKTPKLCSVSDLGAGVDTLSALSANIPATDAGAGVDSLSALFAAIFASDSGAGVEVPAIVVPVSDSGLGTDILSALATNIPISDSGMGADAWLRDILVGYVMIGGVILDALARVNRWEGSRDECDLDITLFGDPATIKQKEAELTEQAKYAGQLDVMEPPYAARIWQDRSPAGENRIFVTLKELGVFAYFLQREFSSEAAAPAIRRVRFRLVKV